MNFMYAEIKLSSPKSNSIHSMPIKYRNYQQISFSYQQYLTVNDAHQTIYFHEWTNLITNHSSIAISFTVIKEQFFPD